MSLPLIDPPPAPRESRTIRLTPEQFEQLDDAIARASTTPEPYPCLVTLMVCITDITLTVTELVVVIGARPESRIEYLPDDGVRLVHPTLEQLLEVRNNALLRA
jgi:hypothetical protein